MSTTSLILFVIAGLCVMWQVALVFIATAYIKSGRFHTVNIGLVPIMTATVFTIAGIFTR